MKQIFLLIALLVLQTSCFDKINNTNPDEPVTINVDISKIESDSLNLSEIAYKVEYIPLQTTDSVLLADVYDFSIVHDNYFIKSHQLIYRFDGNGKYLNKVYNLGNGPEEIIPICFAVNEIDSSVYVYGWNNHINIYSYSGEYLNTIEKPINPTESLPPWTLSFFHNYLFIAIAQRPFVKYIYSCYDSQKDSLFILCNNYRIYSNSQMEMWPTLIPWDYHYQITDSFLLYKENFSDTIYSADKNLNQRAEYIINLSDDKLEWVNWRDTRMFIVSDNPPGGYVVQSFVETDSQVIFTLNSFKDPGVMAVFNIEKRSATLYPCNGDKNKHTQQMQQFYLRNDLDGLINFPVTDLRNYFNYYQGCVYVAINAVDFKEAYSAASEKAKTSSEYLRKMYPLLSKVNEDDNPVIVKVYLK